MEALAIATVLLLVAGVHILGARSGRRMRTRLRDPARRPAQLRRLMWFCALGAAVVIGVIVWGNTGGRSMNALGWVRYGLFLAAFVAGGVWAAVRRAPDR